MAEQSTQLVQKLRNYCNILRDDGLSYGDYVEQLTFLLFLKMADEQSRPPFNKRSPIPQDFDWRSLLKRDGDELETHYRHVLESLVNLENPPEESKIGKIGIGARWNVGKCEKLIQHEKPAFSVEDFDTGLVSVSPGWLNEVWKK